ncbi:MAG: GTP-binding protein EngB [Candidatus Asgardarchaeia archaeon]
MKKYVKHKKRYIIFVGRPNTGKSTIIKQLTNFKTKVGKKPGATRKFSFFEVSNNNICIVDFPGFGFMHGVPKRKIEDTKKMIVSFLEKFSKNILLAFHVIDASTYREIKERLEKKGIRPFDEELSSFLRELNIDTITVVNKIDKIKSDTEMKNIIDEIRHDLKIFDNTLIGTSAKKQINIRELRKLAISKLIEKGVKNTKSIFK